jgi:hypothetical protein
MTDKQDFCWMKPQNFSCKLKILVSTQAKIAIDYSHHFLDGLLLENLEADSLCHYLSRVITCQ